MKAALVRPLRWLGIAYLSYLAVALLVVLPLLNILAPRLVQGHLQRELQSELLLYNPFTLAVELRRASLHEADGHRPLALKLLRVDLSLSSLWEPGIVFDALRVEELDLHVLRHDDGRFHFSDLLPAAEDDTPPAESAPLPGLTLRRVDIDAHTLRFTDNSRPGGYSNALRDLQISTQNITTVPDRRGDGDLVLSDASGGSLRWAGDLDIAAGHSSGTLRLEHIDLTHLWRYQASDFAFAVNSSLLDATLDYEARWDGEPRFSLRESALRLHAVEILPADPGQLPHTSLALQDLSVAGIALDSVNRRLEAGSASIRGFALQGFDDEQGVSPALMLSPASDGEDPAIAEPGTDDTDRGEDPGDDAGWQLALDEFTLDDSRLDWRTGYLAPDVMQVRPLRARIAGIGWPSDDAATFELALTLNEEMQLDIDGALTPSSGDGVINAVLERWQLAWLNPLLNEQARTDFRSGALGIRGSVNLADYALDSARLDAAIDGLVTELHETGEQAFKLEQLTLSEASLAMAQRHIGVEAIELTRPIGSLHIREDGSINVNGVVRRRADGEVDEPPETDEAEDTSEANEVDEAGPAEAPPWTVLIDRFALRNGQLDFADDSLPLPFRTVIDGIDAEVRDIDSSAGKPLAVEFNGTVDGYAPVVITGSGQPLGEPRQGELAFAFRGIDIATMSPYSGTYAGYRIDSGTLTLDLNYRVEGNSLDGDNRVVISQMQLGEPVESELAMDLPLKLGIALLTDTRGVIDLSVPISGDMDDPEFSLGGVIGKAIANVLAKAVTAPFRLLAGLVGSSDDLENIAFEPGSAALSADAQRSLGALGTALAERPQLQLRISGGFDPAADRRALQQRELDNLLLAGGLAADSLTSRDDAWAAAVVELYASQPVPGEETEEGGENALSPSALYDALVASRSLPANALEELATARAAAAKRDLVTIGGIDAARIAISTDAALASAGAQMHLDS